MTYSLIALAAYLIGSFCASIPMSRHKYASDIRTQGSGNAGATNMARVYGMKAGVLTFLLDAVKTVAAMLLGHYLDGETGKAIAGACCVIGHCFPVYFRFRGGKGVSVGAALAFMTHPLAFLAILVVFLAAAFLSRKVSLGSILAAASLPFAVLALGASRPMLIMCVLSAVLVIFMHRTNISRLIHGTESDFSPKKSG